MTFAERRAVAQGLLQAADHLLDDGYEPGSDPLAEQARALARQRLVAQRIPDGVRTADIAGEMASVLDRLIELGEGPDLVAEVLGLLGRLLRR